MILCWISLQTSAHALFYAECNCCHFSPPGHVVLCGSCIRSLLLLIIRTSMSANSNPCHLLCTILYIIIIIIPGVYYYTLSKVKFMHMHTLHSAYCTLSKYTINIERDCTLYILDALQCMWCSLE